MKKKFDIWPRRPGWLPILWGLLITVSPAQEDRTDSTLFPAAREGQAAGGGEHAGGGGRDVDRQFLDAVEAASKLAGPVGAGPVLTLDQALWSTLALQPTIRLAEEDIRNAEAFFSQSQGAFDWNLLLDLQKRQDVLPLSQQEIERQALERRTLEGLSDSFGRAAEAVRRGDRQVTVTVPDGNGGFDTRRVDVDSILVGSGASEMLLETGAVNRAGLANSLGSVNRTIGSPNVAALQRMLRDQQETTFRTAGRMAAQSAGSTPVDRVSRVDGLSYQAALSKLFRNGAFVTPGLNFDQTDADNIAEVSLDFIVPLLKDRGARLERASEKSALIDFEASSQQLLHTYSVALVQTAAAFWNALARAQEVELLRYSEAINLSFVDLTRLRVDAGETEESELSKALSSLMSVRANRLSAEFGLIQARRDLAFAIGLEGAELMKAPFARGSFPLVDAGRVSMDSMVNGAVAYRRDLVASRLLRKSGKILADAARKNIGPRLDFNMRLAATGRSEGTHFEELFTAYGSDTAALGVFGGLTFQWPLQDRIAKGQYLSAASGYYQRSISAADLERQVRNGAALAFDDVRISRQQVRRFEEAAGHSMEALLAERARFDEGEASLLDTIQVQDQYIALLRNVINAHQRHGSAVSGLRFQTGTLIRGGTGAVGDHKSVESVNVTTLPKFDESSNPALLNPQPRTWKEQLESLRETGSESGKNPPADLRPVSGLPDRDDPDKKNKALFRRFKG